MIELLGVLGCLFAIFRCGVEHGRILEREPLHEPRAVRLLDDQSAQVHPETI